MSTTTQLETPEPAVRGGGAGRGPRTAASAVAKKARESNLLYIFLALVTIVTTFAVLAPSGTFLSIFNLQTIANDASVILIFAVGATLVIISGNLDLSQGSVATFSAVVSVQLMKNLTESGSSPWLAIAVGAIVGIACGTAWGAINGWLVAVVRLDSFIVTLGTFGAGLGAARLLTNGLGAQGAPDELTRNIGLGDVAGIPVPFLIAVLTATVFGIGLAKTRSGEHLYLVGSNEEAARRAGINVRRRQFTVFMWSGAISGLAGVVTVARFSGEGVANGHFTELITAISGVVIGGASIAGGSGLMLGTVLGVGIPVVLNNGLIILQVQRFWQEVAVGTILVAAVAFDQWRRAKDIRP